MSAFGSGPDDAPTIISLEDVGKPATFGMIRNQKLNQTTQNNPNTAANANIAIQQTVSITAARTMGDISAAGEVDAYSFDATAGDRVYVGLQSSSSTGSNDTLIEILAQDGASVFPRDDDDGSFFWALSDVGAMAGVMDACIAYATIRHARLAHIEKT